MTVEFSHYKCNQVSAHFYTTLKLIFLKAIFIQICGFDLKEEQKKKKDNTITKHVHYKHLNLHDYN